MSKNQDHADLCHFTFADGRRCSMPQFPDDLGLCFHHGQKYRAAQEAKQAGREISEFLNTDILTACDLSSTLSTLFAATAQGYIKPKTACALGYLAQLMLQTQKRAKEEFLESFQNKWPEVVRESPAFNPPEPESQPPAEPPAVASASQQTPSSPLVPEPPPATEAEGVAPTLDDADFTAEKLIAFPANEAGHA
jgi:hypothetical protein